MSYQALEVAFTHPNLTLSKLRQFRKEHLENFCKANSINVKWIGAKEPTKAAYTNALFNARPGAAKKADPYTRSSPTSYQALEEAFAHPKLTISKLQQFRKEYLQNICEAKSIDVQWKGAKKPTKAAYTNALFKAWQKMMEKPTGPEISEGNFAMEIDETLLNTSQDIGTRAPSLVVNGSGLKIRIPVLKRKRSKRHLESGKKNSILVRAYSRRGDDKHISEAEVNIDSTGGLAVKHVAEKLKLKGILRLIYPRNRYPYDLSSQVNMRQEEIEELQDADGVLMVTFNQNYSKWQRPKRHVIEFLESTACRLSPMEI